MTPTVHAAAGHKEAVQERAPTGLGGNTKGSEGYGELTQGSMSRLCALLANLRGSVLHRLGPADLVWAAEYDLGDTSSFVDIGSGYGKAVMHVALLSKARVAVGIECVISRHSIAEQALNEMRYELLINPTAAQDDDPPRGGDEGGGAGSSGGATDPFAGVTFHFGDATVGRVLAFTHVYAFDRVFSPTTMRALARLLRRSPFRIFSSFRSIGEWWACGLRILHPVARLRVTTTGKESMSIHIYANLLYAPR